MKILKETVFAAALAALMITHVSCASTGTGNGASSAAARGVKPYTRDTCLVSGNKLGSMGDPVSIVHESQEVKFCCRPCVAKFKAKPEKYLAKMN